MNIVTDVYIVIDNDNNTNVYKRITYFYGRDNFYWKNNIIRPQSMSQMGLLNQMTEYNTFISFSFLSSIVKYLRVGYSLFVAFCIHYSFWM